MDRRAFLAGSMSLLAVPLPAGAQKVRKVPRVGFLCARPAHSSHTEAFERGLVDLGYVPGRDIVIEYRFAPRDGADAPFPRFAADLVRLNVDAIVVGSPLALDPARDATRTVPLIMAQADDPVGAGLVRSLARPGGNLTGLSSMAPEIAAKQVEILKAIVPSLSAVAVLRAAGSRVADVHLAGLQRAANVLGVTVKPMSTQGDAGDIERACAAVARTRGTGMVVLPDMMFFEHLDALVTLPVRHRVPTVYGEREFVDAGGLVSYGTNYDDLFRRAATYVHKVVKGVKPADLPIEQPTKFELAINRKTAQALGLPIPAPLLARADRVIE